jgi:hypothetical protein
MKKLLILSVLVSQVAWAGCNLKSASYLTNEHTVGDITNLVEQKDDGVCKVAFDITVDGKLYHRAHTTKDVAGDLCARAIEQSRKDLLLKLGGQFKTEAVTSCNEGITPKTKIQVGDTILETEVGFGPVVKQYFKYNGARCRMFQEHYTLNSELQTYNGVICQIDNSKTNWLVVDKW